MGKTIGDVNAGLSAGDLVAALQEAEEERQRQAERAARPGMIRQSRTAVFRVRRQLVPHTVISLLWTGAHAGQWLPDSTTNTAAIYLVVAVVWWIIWGRKGDRGGNRRWRRRYSTLVMFSGGAWLLWAVSEGVSDWRCAALWLGGYALAAPHWWRNRLRIPDEEPQSRGWTGEPQLVLTATQREWNEHIGGQGRFLDGATLENPQETTFGEVYEGRLVRGKHKLTSVTANIELVCSGLDRDLDEVVIDRHPMGGQARFRLKLINRDRNPMHEVQPYPGPTYDRATGLIRIGTYADTEPANFRLHVPGSGLFGGTVIGGTGSGKSRLLEGLASSAAHAVDEATDRGLYVVWVIDPQGGASLPAWAKHADWAATEPDEIARMVQALERILDWRSKYNSLNELSHFDPTPERPGLLVIADEFHKVALPGSEATRIFSQVSREGRKAGMALVAADQYPGMPTFGNDEPLRSSLMFLNSIVLRTASRSSRGIIPGLDLDPFDLPSQPGSAYTVSTDGTGKTAPFKAYFVEDAMYWASTAPHTTLDLVSSGAAGPAYQDRHGRRDRARQALLQDFDDLLSGKKTVVDMAPSPAAETAARYASQGGVQVRTPKLAKDADTSAVTKVLAVIGAGASRTGDIKERAGYSETWVRTMLKSLMSTGKVAKLGHGEYELTELGRSYLAEQGIDPDTELLRAAARAVVSQYDRTATPMLLQRELRVDEATAAQLLEQLERLEVVGPAEGDAADRPVIAGIDDLPRLNDRLTLAHVA